MTLQNTPAAVVILAGGSGTRLRSDTNKVYLPLRGRPVLAYSLIAAARTAGVRLVVLVTRMGDEEIGSSVAAEHLAGVPHRLVIGGPDRQASEWAGLDAIRGEIDAGAVDVVAIHDGARPFATTELFGEINAEAAHHGGAIPGLPLAEPHLRSVDGRIELLAGSGARRVQTPQAFRARELLAAYDEARAAGFSGFDTAQCVEEFGGLSVSVVAGDHRNLKVTFAADLAVADAFARQWENGSWVDER